MSATRSIRREEIIGAKIKAMFESPVITDSDGYGRCSLYVQLDNGLAFQSECADFNSPIIAVELANVDCNPIDSAFLLSCIGTRIKEVYESDYWPSIGLYLSNEHLLYFRDFPNVNRSGALLIMPYAERVGQTYQLSDLRPYAAWYSK